MLGVVSITERFTSIHDLQIHAPIPIRLLVEPRSPYLETAEWIRVGIRALGRCVEKDVTDGADVVAVGRGDAAGAKGRGVVCEVAGEGFGVCGEREIFSAKGPVSESG